MREKFESIFPVPLFMQWNDEVDTYQPVDKITTLNGAEIARVYCGQWEGWKAAFSTFSTSANTPKKTRPKL